MLSFPSKDPDERLDYGFDWTARLADGDKIVAAQVTVEAGSVVVEETAHSDTNVSFWASGGTLNGSCIIRCRVTTEKGRIMDQSGSLYVFAS